MKKFKALFLLPLLTLFSCQKNEGEIRTICPVGAPSICYYTEGANDSFKTEASVPNVVAQFQMNEYDAIVVDATTGLNAIKKYDKPYRFAQLLTSGNLYLISYKHQVSPDANSKILSFGAEKAIPNLSLKAYYKKVISCDLDIKNVNRKDGLNEVKAIIENNPEAYDYFVVAEPVLTSLKTSKGTPTFELKLSDESKGVGVIPQAALFLNLNAVNNKKQNLSSYINNMYERMRVCIDSPELVRETLTRYGEDATKTKFGFTPAIVEAVQKNKNNGFAICEPSLKYGHDELKAFLTLAGEPDEFGDEYFIDIGKI